MGADTQAKIISGEIHPFTGPITKQDGTELAGAGKVVDDGTLLGMNFYVKGIDDKVPQ
jgi:simple sugar transport system substrate-binding protein